VTTDRTRQSGSARLPRFARGFTLIEMMLAVAILGMVMVMLSESFHAVAAGKTHAEARLASNREARALLAEMANELHGAIQTPLIASRVLLVGQGRTRNGVPLDNLAISTIDVGHHGRIAGFGAEEEIIYTGQPNPQHRGWYMLTREEHSALLGDSAGIKLAPPVVLATNVLGFHLRYFNGTIWVETWDSHSLPPGQQLPQAVSIDLELAGPGGGPMELSTQVSVPMAFVQW
jgi:prepilin-type N-terminal cleavage/methylation domain-containing protein